VTSGTSGTGNGSVAFLILPNLGATRSGTITVAGQTFTVTQDGLGP
jgi:ABC-type arginine transport system ATPase subunit